jgi:hypothetical protein
LITCYPLAHTPQPYLYNSTLISLHLFKPTPISLQLGFQLMSTKTQFLVEPNSLSLDPSWLGLSSPQP